MCVIEKVRDVYPDRVRTRRTIYQCPRSNGNRLCSLTRIHDLGEIFHEHAWRYDHSRISPGYDTSAVVEVEPRLSSRNRRNIRTFTYGDILRALSLPFSRRGSREARNQRMQDGRVRENIRNSHPTSREPRSSRRFSEPYSYRPPAASSSLPREIISTQSTERQSSPPPVTRQPRRPRERSPAVERVPLRRPQTAPSTPVIIHNRPGQDPIEATDIHSLQDSPAHRHVRFAGFTEYDEEVHDVLRHDAGNNARSERRQHHPAQQEHRRARQPVQDATEEQRHVEETERHRRFTDRNSSSQPSVERNRQENIQTHRTEPAWQRTPPRIIQEGNRRLRDQGVRIIAEARARHRKEGFLRGVFGRR